jgi:DNA replicative helicase MCM subunit Mcm2 (Cdc46/Mcm family)
MPAAAEKFDEIAKEEKLEVIERKKESRKEQKKPKKQQKEKPPVESEGADDPEAAVLNTIKEIEGTQGAAWDVIVENCKKQGLDENAIEEALTSLMDKGFIFEPVLGTIKTT